MATIGYFFDVTPRILRVASVVVIGAGSRVVPLGHI